MIEFLIEFPGECLESIGEVVQKDYRDGILIITFVLGCSLLFSLHYVIVRDRRSILKHFLEFCFVLLTIKNKTLLNHVSSMTQLTVLQFSYNR
jgi:hypothetical protein